MQIVIDIPEIDFEYFVSTSFVEDDNNISKQSVADREAIMKLFNLVDSVKESTPLLKGHGRLIDADVFEKRLMNARLYYIGEKADDFDLRFAAGLKSAAERLVDAPTIIEADRESRGYKR